MLPALTRRHVIRPSRIFAARRAWPLTEQPRRGILMGTIRLGVCTSVRRMFWIVWPDLTAHTATSQSTRTSYNGWCQNMDRGPRHRSSWPCGLIVAAAIAIGAVTMRACAEPLAYDLVIERSPIAAGTVTPTIGMHRFSANSMVLLTAEPQPGYRFAYWLGEVSDPTTQRTTVRVDAHKVVIAVFHPEPREHIREQFALGGGGDAMMISSPGDLRTPSWSPGGGREPGGSRPAVRPEIITPEPGTMALLGLGALYLRRRVR